jgi:lipopolysaccharide heptosyltransferase I
MSAVGPSSPPPSSLLLVRLGAVGDVIRTLPLLHALRGAHPECRIGWAVEEASAGLLRAVRALDRVHVLPRRSLARALRRPWRWPEACRCLRSFVRELREERYDVALDAHGTLKAALVARSARATRLVGLGPGGSKEGAHLLYGEVVPYPAGEPLTRIRRALLLGRGAGLLADDAGEAVEHGLRFPASDAIAARDSVRSLARPVAVLFPFASATRKGRRKLWPEPCWSDLGRRLVGKGASVLVAWGSPGEGRRAQRLAGGIPGGSVAPPTDLVELAGLLEEADLLVTGDTGPMHLAAAVGTRCLALFGPSDPVINRPWGPGHEVLVHRPLASLPPEDVADVAARLLRGGSEREAARR